MNSTPSSMDSDLQIAGDLLAVPHLLAPAPEHPTTVSGFTGLARRIAADTTSWRPRVRYDPTSRWYDRLHTGPGYEVWLLSWLPGQGTGLHGHGESSGVLTVLEGELTEHVAAPDGTPRATRLLRPGAQRAFAPGYLHEAVNDGLAPAVSLHVYFPGLTQMPMHARGAREPGRALLQN